MNACNSDKVLKLPTVQFHSYYAAMTRCFVITTCIATNQDIIPRKRDSSLTISSIISVWVWKWIRGIEYIINVHVVMVSILVWFLFWLLSHDITFQILRQWPFQWDYIYTHCKHVCYISVFLPLSFFSASSASSENKTMTILIDQPSLGTNHSLSSSFAELYASSFLPLIS